MQITTSTPCTLPHRSLPKINLEAPLLLCGFQWKQPLLHLSCLLKTSIPHKPSLVARTSPSLLASRSSTPRLRLEFARAQERLLRAPAIPPEILLLGPSASGLSLKKSMRASQMVLQQSPRRGKTRLPPLHAILWRFHSGHRVVPLYRKCWFLLQ